ncbi:hypothetical protein [Vacuolonema iberomarrocanum]|uniref:hypothetical protein n=1 Tax=Vacuolonema iberomarrocanum TaxID=3454632 RepID=UPI0019D8E4BE|nr:hypothetical protein [filamentous cyanobacterium LEGE 07170]
MLEWNVMQESQLDTQAYVDVYPELFAKLKAAGWTGKVRQHDKPRWAREASSFILNMTALDFIVQFEGLRMKYPVMSANWVNAPITASSFILTVRLLA